MPIALRGPRKAMRGKCERGRGKCERGRGSANADGAGAKVFAGDGYSQKASFGPMAAISRRGQAGRIYNNTRARVLLRRMCVKPADRTTHSPPKTFARPRTATRPSRTLPLPHAAPTHARRLRDARPPPSQHLPRRRVPLAPAQRHALAEHFRSPTQRQRPPPQPRRTPAGCAMHARRPHHPFPAEDLRSLPHSDTPFPSTSAPPRSPDARPQAARCTPADRTTHSPPKTFARPRTATRPSRALPLPHAAPTHARRLRDAFPADLTTPSPPKTFSRPRTATRPSRALLLPHAAPTHAHAAPTHTRRLRDARPPTAQPIPRTAPPCLSFCSASGTKKRHRTVHVRCRMSRSTVVRSVIWVGEPRAVRRRCGALACRRGA